jgi:hypothetical protein
MILDYMHFLNLAISRKNFSKSIFISFPWNASYVNDIVRILFWRLT